MKLTVIGTGYVGLVTGACFAEVGHKVTCVDVDKQKIENLNKGILPIYEPGLETIVASNLRDGRLRFTTDLADPVAQASVYFIAVGTPQGEDGSADVSYVLDAARSLGKVISADALVVNKSTVPIGTAEKIKDIIAAELAARKIAISWDVVSNPEFLKQGAAIKDFMKPDRIIIGCETEAARETMRRVYASFTRNHDRILFMDRRAAEMTKYTANAMLATKISFMNEIANLCDLLGVDVEQVRKGIGSDTRIGYSFIYPGCGYGGSCFPKDVKALINIAERNNFDATILRAIETRNQRQKLFLFEKITERFGADLTGLVFGFWGLSFKPGTDDMREAPSIVLLKEIIAAGGSVKAFDPVAMPKARGILPAEWFYEGKLTLASGQYQAIDEVDALVLVTEWKQFMDPDFELMKAVMKRPLIFDGRNQYEPVAMKAMGFEYWGVGRKAV